MCLKESCLLWMGCLLIVTSYSIKGVSNLSKDYNFSIFGKVINKRRALDNIVAEFPPGITTLCGPSKSGKSTLAKVIIGYEDYADGRIDYVANNNFACSYVDNFFCSKYDDTKTVQELFASKNSLDSRLYTEVLRLQVPTATPISQLLESQRKLFEVYYSLEIKRSDVADSFIVVLDEYFDKDLPKVYRTVIDGIRKTISSGLHLQVFVITHSKKVFLDSSHVVMLRHGLVYSQGSPNRVVVPSNLVWI